MLLFSTLTTFLPVTCKNICYRIASDLCAWELWVQWAERRWPSSWLQVTQVESHSHRWRPRWQHAPSKCYNTVTNTCCYCTRTAGERGSFISIRQVAPMCTHCLTCFLGPTWLSVLRRHRHPFSRFCTAHRWHAYSQHLAPLAVTVKRTKA